MARSGWLTVPEPTTKENHSKRPFRLSSIVNYRQSGPDSYLTKVGRSIVLLMSNHLMLIWGRHQILLQQKNKKTETGAETVPGLVFCAQTRALMVTGSQGEEKSPSSFLLAAATLMALIGSPSTGYRTWCFYYQLTCERGPLGMLL